MHTAVISWIKIRGLLVRKCVFTPRGHISAFLVDRPEINFSTTVSTWKSFLESSTIKRVLFRCMGIFPSWRNLGASIVRKESYVWSISECRVKSEMANYVNFARRMRLPALHFQLDDHIPTTASYQTSIISLGVQPPPMAVSQRLPASRSDWAIVWGKCTSQWGQWGY